MLPFKVQLKPGISPYRQIVYAVEKARVCGQLRAGDPFPSVRALSQACKINPNTAHKVIAELVRRGILEVRPGIGTVVADAGRAAKRLSLSYEELVSALREHWESLSEKQKRNLKE
jgi:GntR family transcriptional regulator